MSRDQQRLTDYLDHILEAITRIQRYTKNLDQNNFLQNELIQDAVIRNIEIIGEASNNVNKHYPDFVTQQSHIPFSLAYEMRNALAHGYFKVDMEIVWKTLERDLPKLKFQIEELQKAST